VSAEILNKDDHCNWHSRPSLPPSTNVHAGNGWVQLASFVYVLSFSKPIQIIIIDKRSCLLKFVQLKVLIQQINKMALS